MAIFMAIVTVSVRLLWHYMEVHICRRISSCLNGQLLKPCPKHKSQMARERIYSLLFKITLILIPKVHTAPVYLASLTKLDLILVYCLKFYTRKVYLKYYWPVETIIILFSLRLISLASIILKKQAYWVHNKQDKLSFQDQWKSSAHLD